MPPPSQPPRAFPLRPARPAAKRPSAQDGGAVVKARQWVNGLFGGKGGDAAKRASTFSLENGALTLHEPPAVLRATAPQTDEEVLQARRRPPIIPPSRTIP